MDYPSPVSAPEEQLPHHSRISWLIGGTLVVLGLAVIAFFLLRSDSTVPRVPLPRLNIGEEKNTGMLTASVAGDAEDLPVQYLEPKWNVPLQSGIHYLVRIPAIVVDPVPVSLLVNSLLSKKIEFFIYKYQGTELPFQDDAFHYSRKLIQQIPDIKKQQNFTVTGGDLLYIWINSGGFTLSIEQHFDPTIDLDREVPVICGDGIVKRGVEECDDGNRSNGDGCTHLCKIESVCGNRKVERGEQCDDGNRADGDGCDRHCQDE